MDTEEFVAAIKRHVRDAAVADTLTNLKNPPGRRISPAERARSDWFNGLSAIDAAFVERIVASSADEAIFGLFAVLDGSRVIEDGRFELAHVNEKRVVLNDPDKIGLNEVFNAIE